MAGPPNIRGVGAELTVEELPSTTPNISLPTYYTNRARQLLAEPDRERLGQPKRKQERRTDWFRSGAANNFVTWSGVRAQYCVSSTTTTTTLGSDSSTIEGVPTVPHYRHFVSAPGHEISHRHFVSACHMRTYVPDTDTTTIHRWMPKHQREFADPASWSGKLCTHRATIVNRLCHPNQQSQ